MNRKRTTRSRGFGRSAKRQFNFGLLITTAGMDRLMTRRLTGPFIRYSMACSMSRGYRREAAGIGSPMHARVTRGAEGHQVFFRVLPQPTARFDVVNLQFFQAPAGLAEPSIASQDLLKEFAIGLGRKAFSLSLGKPQTHGVAPTCCRTDSLCSAGSMPGREQLFWIAILQIGACE